MPHHSPTRSCTSHPDAKILAYDLSIPIGSSTFHANLPFARQNPHTCPIIPPKGPLLPIQTPKSSHMPHHSPIRSSTSHPKPPLALQNPRTCSIILHLSPLHHIWTKNPRTCPIIPQLGHQLPIQSLPSHTQTPRTCIIIPR